MGEIRVPDRYVDASSGVTLLLTKPQNGKLIPLTGRRPNEIVELEFDEPTRFEGCANNWIGTDSVIRKEGTAIVALCPKCGREAMRTDRSKDTNTESGKTTRLKI